MTAFLLTIRLLYYAVHVVNISISGTLGTACWKSFSCLDHCRCSQCCPNSKLFKQSLGCSYDLFL